MTNEVDDTLHNGTQRVHVVCEALKLRSHCVRQWCQRMSTRCHRGGASEL